MRRNWYLIAWQNDPQALFPTYSLRLVEEPVWAAWAEWWWELACLCTGGWAGGHGMPDWLWKVPAWWPKWDRTNPDDTWLVNSIPSKLMDLENWVLGLTHTHGRQLVTIPIDRDTARKIAPEFVQMDEELEEEE